MSKRLAGLQKLVDRFDAADKLSDLQEKWLG
jgi:hypothetical protein